jgi:hypothetical protein
MSSVPLPADDLHRRVAGTVGKLDAGALTQPSMRPERECISLVLGAFGFRRSSKT